MPKTREGAELDRVSKKPRQGPTVAKGTRGLSRLTKSQLIEKLIKAQEQVEDLQARDHEQSRVRGQLAKTQVRLNALLASTSRVSIIATDLDGVITVFNRGAERMLGYTADEMLGRQTPTLIHLESELDIRSRELVEKWGVEVSGFAALTAAASRGGYDHREWTYVRKDGTSFPVDLITTALRDEFGEINGFLGVATDISERKLAMDVALRIREDLERKVLERTDDLVQLNESLEQEIAERRKAEATLRQSEENYRGLVDNLSVGIYRNTVEDGVFLQANPALVRMFGFESLKEFKRQPSSASYQNEEDRIDFINTLLEKGSVANYELGLKQKDGTPFWGSISAVVKYGDDGEPAWIDGVVEDITARKEAEEAFRAGEERYRTLIEESFDGIFLQKGDRIIFANQRVHNMLDYSPGDLVGIQAWNIYAKEYQELTRQRTRARLEGESAPPRYEVKCLRRDGTTFEAEVFEGVTNLAGEPAVQVCVRDITVRRRALEALAASEERFRCLSENAPDIIYTLGLDGSFTYVNPAWERIMGHCTDEVLGRYFIDFAKSNHRLEIIRLFRQIRDHKDTVFIKGQAIHKDGSVRYLDMSGAPNLDREGRVIGVVGMLKDITQAVMAEQALRASEERRQAALAASPDPVVIYDMGGNVIYINTAFTRVFGWEPNELMGHKIDFVPKEEEHRTYPLIEKILKGAVVTAFETRRYTKDGQIVDVSISAARYTSGDDEGAGIIATIRNVTEAKKAQAALQKSEASLARAQKMAHLGNWELDLATGRLSCSEEVCNILGVTEAGDTMTLRRLVEATHPDDRSYVEETLAQATEISGAISMEHRIVRPDGEERIVMDLAEVEFNQSGMPVKLVGAMQDITERRRSEEQMLLLAQVFETTIEGILVTDSRGIIEMVNPAFTAITGFTAEEAVGQSPRILNSRRQSKEFYEEMWADLAASGHWQGEIWNRRKGGEAYPEWLTITAIKDSHDRVTHYVGVFHDITEIKRTEEQITYQAYHDALTGLPNRLLFNDRLTMSIAHAQRKHQGLSVLFLDLDHFKNINDSLGHAVGDMLLVSVAKRLKKWSRDEDTVARIGGDEFIMLLQGTDDPEYAVHVARRILESLAEPFRVKEHELYVSASIGITLYPHDGDDIEALVSNADLAMYRAKEDGRNNYKLFTPAMNAQVVKRMALEGSLRKALERGEFLVHYQPKVDLGNGEIVGVEALVRWMRPAEGLVPPDQFIPVAEDTGLIIPLGRWVLSEACRTTKRWHDQGFDNLQVAVNLSPRQFRQKNLVMTVREILEETGLPPASLELEVTENVVMYSVEEAIETMRHLVDLGVRLSMDDFGRGYSSLYYLKRFPMNTLKIDQSFVRDVAEDPDDASIVNTIISMSRSLNLKVIAEGVESEEQLEFLRQHNCDQMQGFLFSRPVPAEDVTKMLIAGKSLG